METCWNSFVMLPDQWLDSTNTELEAKIAHLHKLHIIVHILGPEILKLIHSYVKPRFHVAIVMDDCSIVDLIHADAGIVAKPQNMPGFVQCLCCCVKGDQARRKSTQLP